MSSAELVKCVEAASKIGFRMLRVPIFNELSFRFWRISAFAIEISRCSKLSGETDSNDMFRSTRIQWNFSRISFRKNYRQLDQLSKNIYTEKR